MLLFVYEIHIIHTNLAGIQEQINVMDNALREMENGKENTLKIYKLI